MDNPDLENAIRELLASQKLGALATHDGRQAHASLVAFAATGDLRRLIFATPRSTRKHESLTAFPGVAMLIDTRNDGPDVFRNAAALTAAGRAVTLAGGDGAAMAALLRGRHPQLGDFLADPGTALVAINVEAYHLVRRFQEVRTLSFSQSDPS